MTTLTVDYLGARLEVEADYEPYRPGCLTGPPEACYPSEPELVDIERVTAGGVDITELCRALGLGAWRTLEHAVLDAARAKYDGTDYDDD